MKHLKTFEKWTDVFITKSYAKDWIKKNNAKAIELNKKEQTIGEFLTKEEQDFMDKYTSMYNIVYNEDDKFYKDYPLAHKSKTYKQRYKEIE